MLFTQRASEALDAGLSGYISRGLFLLIQDQTEALAACAMFNLDRTYERMGRITAKATLGSAANDVGTAPNWSSMRALRRQRSDHWRSPTRCGRDLRRPGWSRGASLSKCECQTSS